jgi:hypothetical protein
MAGLYEDLIKVVDGLLKKFGAQTTFIHVQDGTYDASSASVVRTAGAVDIVFAAVFDFDEKFVNGTSIRAGDKQIFMSTIGASSPPKIGDEFVWGNLTFQIVQYKPIAPNRTAVLYELQGRLP